MLNETTVETRCHLKKKKSVLILCWCVLKAWQLAVGHLKYKGPSKAEVLWTASFCSETKRQDGVSGQGFCLSQKPSPILEGHCPRGLQTKLQMVWQSLHNIKWQPPKFRRFWMMYRPEVKPSLVLTNSSLLRLQATGLSKCSLAI